MQRTGGHPTPVQLVDLIFHQRDERRDHDRHAREQDGGQLVTQRLSGSCRHHREHVVTGEDRIDDALLPGPEMQMTEVRAQR
ncbi:MAG TPA: hypothetical protein VEA16_00175 [Vicinamibacterales bacterium]|nr:hypothetical protein [Vicinamibacterales bacterium]